MRKKQVIIFSFIFLISSLVFFNIGFNVNADEILYHVDKEWARIWVNIDDGSIDLFYNITISCDQGSFRTITVGMPNRYFNVGWVQNNEGSNLDYEDVSSGDYSALKVILKQPVFTGESATVTLLARVDSMVWEHNDTYVGVAFIPTWWDAQIFELMVTIVLPEGVKQYEFGCNPDPCDNYFFDTAEENKLVLYWERFNLSPNTKIEFGASFPKEYVAFYHVEEVFPFWNTRMCTLILVIGFLIITAVIVIIIVVKRRRLTYERPRLSVEALGPRRGLTAVEAATVLDLKPMRTLTMILFGLLLKKTVWVETIEPKLKLRIFRESKQKLRNYEKAFIKAIKPEGLLDERKLAKTYANLKGEVDVKMRGYSRLDTRNYYKSIVKKAWDQVTQADTPQLKAETFDNNLLWLLSDEKYEERFRGVFDPTSTILLRPSWHWYWYGWYYPTHPGLKPPEVNVMPAVDFANSIVTMLEQTSNRLVADVDRFVNKLIPQQTRQTSKPIHHRATCACACASCACACACVSCACACAGGGVG